MIGAKSDFMFIINFTYTTSVFDSQKATSDSGFDYNPTITIEGGDVRSYCFHDFLHTFLIPCTRCQKCYIRPSRLIHSTQDIRRMQKHVSHLLRGLDEPCHVARVLKHGRAPQDLPLPCVQHVHHKGCGIIPVPSHVLTPWHARALSRLSPDQSFAG